MKTTHGPCMCTPTYDPVMMRHVVFSHAPDCPSLYPAQQEPDALTRMVRHVRNRMGANSVLWEEGALALISEARTEAREALDAERQRADAAENRARDLQNDLNWLQRRLDRMDNPP